MSGRTSHLHGLAAEDAVLRHYEARGARLLARRARTAAGEIDLVVEAAGAVVFVEVKARRSLADAAHALSARQGARLAAAAELWLAEAGYPPGTDLRLDVALADRAGGLRVIENALA